MTTSPRRTRRVVFVSPRLTGESLRAARAVKQLEGVRLLGICEQPPVVGGEDVVDDLMLVHSVYQTDQLLDASRRLAEKHGALEKIVTVQETLLIPVALVGEALELDGMSVSAARRTLDKTLLKQTLRAAGTGIARDRVITDSAEARRFVNEVGYPLVLKPLDGSGGLATWRIRNDEHLRLALELIQPGIENPVLAEDYLSGRELCIDTITLAGEPRFHSLCCYQPTILEALENPAIQWRCVMPRAIDGARYQPFIEQGLTAVRALSAGNAVTHMEGFLLDDGSVRFTDATLRPAGARIAPMLAFAYDMDPHLAWARVAVDGCFDGPWERQYAVGTIFLRGVGQGYVESVEGLQRVKQQFGKLVVDSRLPRVGAAKCATYTGDGFITVRAPLTWVVNKVLDDIARTVIINYSEPGAKNDAHSNVLKSEWAYRLNHFDRQLNKPAWDDDSLPSFDEFPSIDRKEKCVT